MGPGRLLGHICVLGIVATAAAFAACNDDDGDSDDAEALGDAYQEFVSTIAGASDISAATDVQKERLTENCGEMDDGVEVDGLGDFCNTLDEAVDDEDQPKFDDAKAQWATLEPRVRAEIEAEIADVAVEGDEDGDADDDRPLEGGDNDDGDSDTNDGN